MDPPPGRCPSPGDGTGSPGDGAGSPGDGAAGTAPGGDGTDGTGCPGEGAPAPWPHLVDGIIVPGPDCADGLEGLDPIDPACTDPAVRDKRTHGQKLLDGLLDAVRLAARTGLLPVNGGLKPQLLISTTEADLQASRARGTGCGIAFLPYTGPNNLTLFDTDLCDADVTTMILGNGQDILNVGRTQRFFTDAQRKILAARDIGCTFPHCTRPAAMCDAHHVIPWQDGGETSIENGALLCAYHHTLLHQGHWTLRLHNGTPLYTPAYAIDPTRTERRNTYHHGLIPTS
ncbi:HNH endonuclease signature motif containing protein, partial [Arthrobacter wenxiniae]